MLKIRGYEITPEFLASRIDYAVVIPEMDERTVDEHIQTCIRLGTNVFCVQPHYLKRVAEGLKGSKVKPASVIDYPDGCSTQSMKLKMAEECVKMGSMSLDMVIDFAAVKNHNWKLLTDELKDLVSVCGDAETKPIIECTKLTKDEIVSVTKCCEEAGVSYIKTGSGRMAGPEWHDILLIRDTLSKDSKTRIKFSGTGRFWTSAVALGGFACGADIIGTRS
ncbi:MAG: deoxyribose-phosphate aldolase, partial [Lachnospiraceae bacterium]|nr:deoxyribose-phosphate aldolase [Lachnospiraceae bacterium]